MLYWSVRSASRSTRLLDWRIKNNYHSKLSQKLSDKTTSSGVNWSILKTFLNGKTIPCISNVFHDNKFVTDFKEKAGLIIIIFFAEQCLLPKQDNEVPNNFPFLTEKYFQISKTHGRDMINIRMLKLCDLSLCKPLSIVLKSWFS